MEVSSADIPTNAVPSYVTSVMFAAAPTVGTSGHVPTMRAPQM